MNENISRINALYNQGLEAKDIARRSDNDLEQYKIASNFYEKAVELIDLILKNTDYSNINFITQTKALREYYLYESNECLYAFDYKRNLFETAIVFATKAKKHIQYALKIIDENFDQLNEETKSFLLTMKSNWTLSIQTIPIRQLEPIAKRAMLNKDYITALDSYREMWELQDKAHSYVINSQLPEVFKRTERGNYLASKASISMSLAGVYVAKSINNNYQKEILEQFLIALDYIKQAQEINPEQDKYKVGKDQTIRNIREILEKNPDNWDAFYYNFEGNTLLNNIMKETNVKKFNETELKRKLNLNENKGKKLLIFGGFWLSVFIILMSSISILFMLNIPWWSIILIVLLVQFAYALISATVLRNLGDLSEKGLLEIYKLTIKYNFNLFNSNKPGKEDAKM
ncbi:hypothetical protein [Flavobacterium ginsenosidimutans]|uniref:Competence protein n=1 Tax=Flavobacterium ginsenosidimutans TaxID=687844 RepID=A0ABZ2Q3V4_9FLAO